jgi:hypothetical protein
MGGIFHRAGSSNRDKRGKPLLQAEKLKEENGIVIKVSSLSSHPLVKQHAAEVLQKSARK